MRGKVCIESMTSYLQTQSSEQATYNQSQGSSAFGVNEEQSRDRSNDLDGTIAQRRVQGLGSCVTDPFEDSRAVERDDCEVLGHYWHETRGDLLLIPHIC